MNKIVLSALAALTIGTVGASAGDVKFYSDDNGQVYTTAGEGRTEVKMPTPVHSKASKLKFSGLTYLGFVSHDYKNRSATSVAYQDDTAGFELRRGYFQLKAYLLDDPKSYFRVTYDLKQSSAVDTNSVVVRAKYAYLFLNEILPATGLEVGLAHRPWHDYEEHNAWYFRNTEKVLLEAKNSADLSNSADFGAMLKTRTKYFDADYGIFNGEGYHGAQAADDGMSFEWRATAHLLGVSGKDKQTKKTYWDASFYGQYNQKHKADANAPTGYDDLVFGGIHTVFNMPSFLIAAQYLQSLDTADNSTYVSNQAGSGFSVNAEARFGHEKEFRPFARYDSWTKKQLTGTQELAQRMYIGGVAWEQNKNVQWVANAIVTDNEESGTRISERQDYNGVAYMVTAEIKF